MKDGLFASNKIFSYYEDAKELRDGYMVVPRFVSIWLTTTCDLKCGYCYFNKNNKEKKFFDYNKIKELLQLFANMGIEAIEFSGGGEPTLHPQCFDIAKYAYGIGLKVGMLTNGYKFDFNYLPYFQYVRFGLDASDEKTYKTLKGGSEKRFNATIKMIKDLMIARGKNKRPLVGVKFMIDKNNFSEFNIVNMVALATHMDVDYCYFKSPHNDVNQLSVEEQDTAEGVLESIRVLYKGVYGTFKFRKPKINCFLAPIHTVITATGDVLNCCYFNSPKHVIGNVFKQNFKDLWFSDRHKEVMKVITIEDCAKVDCRWHRYNKIMHDELTDNKSDLSYI